MSMMQPPMKHSRASGFPALRVLSSRIQSCPRSPGLQLSSAQWVPGGSWTLMSSTQNQQASSSKTTPALKTYSQFYSFPWRFFHCWIPSLSPPLVVFCLILQTLETELNWFKNIVAKCEDCINASCCHPSQPVPALLLEPCTLQTALLCPELFFFVCIPTVLKINTWLASSQARVLQGGVTKANQTLESCF